MKRDRSFRSLAVVAVLVATVGLGVAFAALAQQLNIDGDIVVRSNSLLVEFDNLREAVNGAESDVSATLTATTLTFNADLAVPGDSVIFEWDVVNIGTLDAVISSYVVIFPDHPNLDVQLTYADGSPIAEGDLLNVGTSRGLRLIALYTVPAGGELPETDLTFTVSAQITYIQNR